jgi:hypothetical protein
MSRWGGIEMSATLSEVEDVANAYRACLAEGDRRLGLVEKRILIAVVTESAEKTAHWVETRVSDGKQLATPLRDFIDPAKREDVFGRLATSSQNFLMKQLQSTVSSLARKGTVPLWLISVGSFIGGLLGFTLDAGAAVGAGLLTLLVGGGSIVYVLSRGAYAIVQSGAVQATGEGIIRSIESARQIGAPALSIYESIAGPTLRRLHAIEQGTTARPYIVTKLRGAATTIVGFAWAAVIVTALFFLAGVITGFSNAAQELYPTPTFPQ